MNSKAENNMCVACDNAPKWNGAQCALSGVIMTKSEPNLGLTNCARPVRVVLLKLKQHVLACPDNAPSGMGHSVYHQGVT